MNAARAKRRLLAWMRYLDSTRSVPANKNLAGYHGGHAKAYSDVTYAQRWAPIGVREPWRRTTRRGGD